MTVLGFLAISLAVISAVVVPTANQIKSVRDLHKAKQGYLAADSVNEEAFYRLNQGQTLPASITLPFSGDISASAEVADVGDTIQVTTTGANGETIRYAKSVFSEGEGASFNYGLQVGNGGLSMKNHTVINGNVYSNGNIVGDDDDVIITGSAVAAAVSNITAEVTNGTTTIPIGGIDLGRTSAVEEIAQSFLMTTTTPVLRISVNLKKIGATNPSNLELEIRADSSGNPTGSQQGSDMTISAAIVASSYGWIDVYPSPSISLNNNQTYWIRLISGDTKASKYYNIATSTGAYANGIIKTKNSDDTWSTPSPSGQDALFEIYTGYSSKIDGVSVGGTASAFTVKDSTVTGNLYCQDDGDGGDPDDSNNKPCDTSQAPPSTLGFSVSEANIDEWKEMASTGQVYNGNLSMCNSCGYEASTTDKALKVIGTLDLSNDSVLTLGGPLYVTGNLNISNDSIIQLASSYGAGDGIVVVEGTTDTNNAGQFLGSGNSASYIMVATKNGNINIRNHGGSVVLVTLNGTANFTNDATAKAVTAYKMNMFNDSVLNYESGLTNINFTTGPSGSWTVDSWGEVSQ